MNKLRHFWQCLLVFLGYKVWAKKVYCRPKRQSCPNCHIWMKRGRKTELGAVYYCPKCKRAYHLKVGSVKLVPL